MKTFAELLKDLSRYKEHLSHGDLTFSLLFTKTGFELLEQSAVGCQYYTVEESQVRYCKKLTKVNPVEFAHDLVSILSSRDFRKLDWMFTSQHPTHPLLQKLKRVFPFSVEKHYVEVYIQYPSRPLCSTTVRFAGSTYTCDIFTKHEGLSTNEEDALLSSMLENVAEEKERVEGVKNACGQLQLPIYEEIENELGNDVELYDDLVRVWSSIQTSSGGP